MTGTRCKLAKRILQGLVAIGIWVPIGAGLSGIFIGPAMVPQAHDIPIPLDSHFRYLSGLLLGIGLGFATTIPHIEIKGDRFRLLAAIVVVGGLARAWAVVAQGVPDRPMIFALVMELVIVPVLTIYQYRLSLKMNLLPGELS